MLNINAILGEYPVLKWRISRRVNDRFEDEEAENEDGSLGIVTLTPTELIVPHGKYTIKRFSGTSEWDLKIQLHELPEGDECWFAYIGNFLLQIPGRDIRWEYKLDRMARRPGPPMSKAEYTALVVEPEPVNYTHQLPEYRVRLTRVKPGERTVKLDYPDNLGQRTKLGGEPDYIQEENANPVCKSCGEPLLFVAQIDSLEHVTKDTLKRLAKQRKTSETFAPWMFEDVGMIYVFYCPSCGESFSFVQSY